ncbi:hypothetical protein CYMTET_49811 [Cymbomonas tetramitiformis]|uniref:Uncharacterized protein n=1 Tax=Cymbomonas tetramitiformis TaxID=36881 RepID=A0AAE0BR52_9CHLO|nr:hypothetical protein CYMTET_49811 [Cymbomonas tetramitiformis]
MRGAEESEAAAGLEAGSIRGTVPVGVSSGAGGATACESYTLCWQASALGEGKVKLSGKDWSDIEWRARKFGHEREVFFDDWHPRGGGNVCTNSRADAEEGLCPRGLVTTFINGVALHWLMVVREEGPYKPYKWMAQPW